MKFSYSAVWDDVMALVRAHLPLIAAVAAAFIFLPALLLGHFLPQPSGDHGSVAAAYAAVAAYYQETWFWQLLNMLANMVGALAILRLVLDQRSPTVGAAIIAAFQLLPFYLLSTIASGFLMFVGLLAFVIPGLYLYGRMAVLGPVIVAENRRNPIDAIKRSFEVTRGRGWAVLFLFVVVLFAATIVTFVIGALIGAILVILGGDLGRFLLLVVTTALSAVVATLLAILMASIYRQLAAVESAARVFD